MTTRGYIRKMYRLIEHEDNWCQKDVAQDDFGSCISTHNIDKVKRRCAFGAVISIVKYKSDIYEEIISLLHESSRSLFGWEWASFICVNNELGHKAICKVFRKAGWGKCQQ